MIFKKNRRDNTKCRSIEKTALDIGISKKKEERELTTSNALETIN